MASRPIFAYGTEPYQHQDIVFERTKDEVAWGLFLDMGCGKSKIFIDTAAWQYCNGLVNAIFLLAPKGVYGNWSDLESGQFITHLPPAVAERSKIFKWRHNHQTKKFQEAFDEFLATDPDDLAIFVMNCEALTSKAAVAASVALLKSRQVIMGVDEATFIKTPTAQVTQKVIKLGRGARSRRVLTGTPVTNSPLDVYSLYEFLNPSILGFNSYFAFRNRYAILKRAPIGQPRPTRERKPDGTLVFKRQEVTIVQGYQRQDELRERMERACVIMRKEDCLDLPSKVYEYRDVGLSKNQVIAYETMRRQSLVELDDEKLVTAPIALTKLLRLHQITLGFLIHEDEFGIKTVHELDPDGGPRVRELLNLVEEIGDQEKIIIFANYTANINTVARMLRSSYEPNDARQRVVAVYDGSTPQEDREAYVKRFQDPRDPLRFLVMHTKTGGFGLTLTQSANTIYFSNNFSLETRLQSEDRNHRIGQSRSVTYVDIRSRGTIDEKIIKVLRNKKELADELTDGGWKRFLEPIKESDRDY